MPQLLSPTTSSTTSYHAHQIQPEHSADGHADTSSRHAHHPGAPRRGGKPAARRAPHATLPGRTGDRAVGGAGQGARERGRHGGTGGGGARRGEDGGLSLLADIGAGVGLVWREHVVDHLHDTVGNEDVGLDDLGRVDVDVVVEARDLDRRPRRRLEGRAVLEVSRLRHVARHEVVAEDLGQGRLVQARERAGKELEARVARDEEGDVGRRGELGDEVRGVERAEEGREVGVGRPRRDVEPRRRDEDRIHDLEEAVGEGHVRGGDGAARGGARRHHDVVSGLLRDDDLLSARHVRVRRVGQQGGREEGVARLERRRRDLAAQHVVLDQLLGGCLVLHVEATGFGKRAITRCEDLIISVRP